MTVLIRKWLGTITGATIFIIALIILRNQLQHYNYRDIITQLNNIPLEAILVSLFLVVANYVVLIIYEIIGFRYIKNPLPQKKIALASFIAFAFSNNVGFYSLSGGAVRFRLYSAWGLSTLDITKVITYSSTLAFWLGLTTISGLMFLLFPLKIPDIFHIPSFSVQILGIIFLGLVAAFLIFSVVRKKPYKIFNWEFDIPSVWLSILLILTAAFDWCLFAGALYALLPFQDTISFQMFLGYFLIAQLAGLISHVPGGLGVFETVLLIVLPQGIPLSAAMGSLIIFRIVYYLVPLCIAAIMLGSHEIYERRHVVKGIARFVSEWSTSIIPNIFAIAIFASGIILLFSGATPAERIRLEWLTTLMPLPILEISHLLGSITGALLLILSWGIYKRLDSAYYLSLYMMAAGVIFSIAKGLDYEEAILLLLILIALFPCKHQFYRKSSMLNDPFSTGWVIAILVVLLSSVWLGFFSYKHIDYAPDLWWKFNFRGNASRFLRASAGCSVVLIIFAFLRLINAAKPKIPLPCYETKSKVKDILTKAEFTYAQLALLGDKHFLLSENNDAFIMYNVQGSSWIAFGDPVGNPSSTSSLIWQFKELSDRHNGRTVFYEVSKNNLHMYIDVGLTLMKLGENAKVNLETFSLEGSARKTLRYANRKLHSDGWEFAIINKTDVPNQIAVLKAISDEWLAEKKTREKRFSLGNFTEEYICESNIAVIRKDSQIVAFSNLLESGTKYELSVDLMRYGKNAPKYVMDYMFTEVLFWGQAQGYKWFDLGMAPFSGMDTRPIAPLWSKFGGLLYKYGENFYNFQGLRFFKEKFDPVWEPSYMACPGGLSFPLVLKDVAILVSSGMKGVVSK